MKDVFEFIVIRFLEIRRFRGGGLSTKTTLEKAKFATIHIAEIEVFSVTFTCFPCHFPIRKVKVYFPVCRLHSEKKKQQFALKFFL